MLKNKALLAVFFSIIFLSACTNTSTTTPPTSTPVVSPVAKLLTWTDPAGFTFQYPDGLTINNHPEDSVNYANLEFNSVKILMQDNKFQNLADWVDAKAKSTEDTILGDKVAIKIDKDGTLILGAIDNDVLVTIEAPVSQEKLFNQIVSSFEFFYPTPTPGSSKVKTPIQPAADENVLEEE